MYSPSNTKTIRPKGAWRFLEMDEPILATDLTRSTTMLVHTDYTDWGAVRDMDWRYIGLGNGKTMGAWIGKTLREFYAFTKFPIGSIEIIRNSG